MMQQCEHVFENVQEDGFDFDSTLFTIKYENKQAP